ncbi:hypothetical protein [Sphingomonas fuzhouensis]|uniref:hypothetical protein n=1 Tax=Sphingomonas fuzhouensis TaxID=3106033 RepID=UPI002AFE6C03|nr:hypothetical protein [Sphingomonas sp. SGZ-02]
MVLVAVATWWSLGRGEHPKAEDGAVVTVPSSRSTAAPVVVATASKEKRLEPPAPPVLPDAMPAAPDAFIGRWRADDGQLLVVNMHDHARYDIALGEERYDGVLKDGHIHFARGIDGDWLQTASHSPCLYLGTGMRFCRL